MKKEYMQPEIKEVVLSEALLGLVENSDGTVTGTPDEEEYDGEFSANRYNVWDDEL